jgi:hypothetical protein
MPSNISITFETETVVKVVCMAKACRNNLRERGFLCCGLKWIDIDEEGRCEQFEAKEEQFKTKDEDKEDGREYIKQRVGGTP